MSIHIYLYLKVHRFLRSCYSYFPFQTLILLSHLRLNSELVFLAHKQVYPSLQFTDPITVVYAHVSGS